MQSKNNLDGSDQSSQKQVKGDLSQLLRQFSPIQTQAELLSDSQVSFCSPLHKQGGPLLLPGSNLGTSEDIVQVNSQNIDRALLERTSSQKQAASNGNQASLGLTQQLSKSTTQPTPISEEDSCMEQSTIQDHISFNKLASTQKQQQQATLPVPTATHKNNSEPGSGAFRLQLSPASTE